MPSTPEQREKARLYAAARRLLPGVRAQERAKSLRSKARTETCLFMGCGHPHPPAGSYCGREGLNHFTRVTQQGVAVARKEWMLNLAQGLDYAIAQARAKRLGHQCTPEGFVYLILFDQWVKLGRTCDVDRRMLAYERAEGVRPVILATAQVDDQFASERTLLDLARQAGLTPTRGNEWFPLEATPILAAGMPRG